MKPRINAYAIGSKAVNGLHALGQAVNSSPLGRPLLELVYYRVSQLNGCAYCLDMHAKDLRAKGETEQRLLVITAWREAPFYTERERAALAWAEALTVIKDGLVPEDIFQQAKQQFTDAELVDLTMAVVAINGYNRINVAFGAEVGTYEPGSH